MDFRPSAQVRDVKSVFFLDARLADDMHIRVHDPHFGDIDKLPESTMMVNVSQRKRED